MTFLDPKPVTVAGLDASVAAKVNDTGSSTRGALNGLYSTPESVTAAVAPKLDITTAATTYRAKADEALNILDFGVVRGTASSQTIAIKTALDANTGKAFYFPPGDYRLDTSLVITAANSLILAGGARIYAGAAMSIMIDYRVPGSAITDFAADKVIIGGKLDGNLLAGTILEVTKVLRLTLTQTTFANGINRGLKTVSPGAEIFASDLRFINDFATNWSDNVALESGMGDCHYSDVVVTNWTEGFSDKSSTKFLRCHVWIGNFTGAQDHIASRYPTSIGFNVAGNTDVIGPYTDTIRTAFKIRRRASDNAPARCRITNGTIYWAGANLSEAMAVANQGYVLDIGEGCDVQFDHNWMLGHGHATGIIIFNTGSNLAKLSSRDNRAVFSINGVIEYRYGVQEGRTAFAPTFAGSSTAGTHTYTAQEGELIVRQNTVEWMFRLKATIGNDAAGNLRIGGLPFPTGAATTRSAVGYIANATAFDPATPTVPIDTTAVGVFMGGASTGPMSAIVMARPGTELGVAALRGKTVEIWGALRATLTTPPQD